MSTACIVTTHGRVLAQLHNATTLVEETAESEQLSTDFPGGKLARCMQRTVVGLP